VLVGSLDPGGTGPGTTSRAGIFPGILTLTVFPLFAKSAATSRLIQRTVTQFSLPACTARAAIRVNVLSSNAMKVISSFVHWLFGESGLGELRVKSDGLILVANQQLKTQNSKLKTQNS
jgi:hypothetical protein